MLSGKHYIAGEWLDGPDVFQADNPSTGEKLPTQFQHQSGELGGQIVGWVDCQILGRFVWWGGGHRPESRGVHSHVIEGRPGT